MNKENDQNSGIRIFPHMEMCHIVWIALFLPGAMSLLVIIGWHLNVPFLIQIDASFAPMQYNTAFGMLLSSLSIGLMISDYKRMAFLLACVVSLLGSLTLFQHLNDVNLGIDQLLMKHYIMVETTHPGRMAPTTALCFMLMGFSVFLPALWHRNKPVILVSTILGTLVLGLGLIVLFEYMSGLVSVYDWAGLARMAIHTAVGFISLGMAMLVYSITSETELDSLQRMHQLWIFTFGALLILYTIVTLQADQDQRWTRALDNELLILQQQFRDRQTILDAALSRKALHGEMEEKVWQEDAQAYLKDFKELSFLLREDRHGNIRFIQQSSLVLTDKSHLVDLYQRAKRSSEVLINTHMGWHFIFSVPVEASDKSDDGKLVSLVSVDHLLNAVSNYKLQNSHLSLTIGDQVIIPEDSNEPMIRAGYFYLYDLLWSLKVQPTSVFEDSYGSTLAKITISLDITLVVLLLLLQYFYFRARNQSEESKQLYKRLVGSLNAMLDSVVIIDGKGTIRDVNTATLALFGYQREELLGQNVKCLMPEPYQSEHDSYLSNYKETGDAQIIGRQRSLKAKKKNGTVMPVTLLVTQNSNEGEKLFTGVIHDLSDVNNIKKSMEEKEAILNTTMQASLAGWAIVDLEGNFSSVNTALADWLGYETSEMIGMSALDVYPEHERNIAMRVMESLIKGERDAVTVERQYIRKDGRLRWGLLSALLVKSVDGKPQLIVSQTISIDQQKLLAQDLQKRNESLEKTNAELDQFAYVASHDLKSPLNAISKLASWIEEDCGDVLPEQSKPHLELLKGRTARMTKLLDDLLTYSRVGRIEYNAQSLNLKEMVIDVMELLHPPSGFKYEVQDITLNLTRTPFEMVLRNLISNAINHHDKDQGLITVSAEKFDVHYVIRVQDDGPGIPASLHDKAIEMFQTLKPRDEKEGSGMGLALCKKTVEYYGGSMKIESEGDSGTTIVLTWPMPDK